MRGLNLAFAAVFAAACFCGPASAEKLRVAYSVWVGYGPLFVAQEKGFFKDEGLDVELTPIEDPKLRFAALAAGQIDLLATSVDAMPQYLKPSRSYRYVFGLDESAGADGVLVSNDVKSVADLKGRTVAYGEGGVTEFYLAVLLRQAGLTLSDIKAVNMSAGDAGSAFVTGQVDAAVTWEPYLSRGVKSHRGYKIADTSKTPGLLADVMIARADQVDQRAGDIAGLYRAWAKAVAFVGSNPDEANAVMGKALGGWLEDPAAIKDVLTGVKLMGADRNAAYFGTTEKPGEIITVIDAALKLWRDQQKLQVDVKAADLIDHRATQSSK